MADNQPTPLNDVLESLGIDGSEASEGFKQKLEALDVFDLDPADLGLLLEVARAENERRERYYAAQTVIVATLTQYEQDGGDVQELLNAVNVELESHANEEATVDANAE